jgi:2-dehydropantoate 2-reductase
MQIDMIDHLVVSVKGPHRLNALLHILFLQNGSGIIKAINKEIFIEKAIWPNYITSIILYRVTLNTPFNIIYTGFTIISLGLIL